MEEPIIEVHDLKKRYITGQIGRKSMNAELQSFFARILGKDDPNVKIGQVQRHKGTSFMALNGINFNVYKGEAVGIIGANGAGKSTLLKLLSRVTAPTAGSFTLRGRIASMLEVGTGFQPEMTGLENIYLNGAILGMTTAEIDAKIDQIIEFSECREFMGTPVKRYSSGMYVKLAFSVAAHLNSDIVVMDEVLAVGDAQFQKKCLARMGELVREEGKTVLYVSHNMNTIRQLCSRCIVLGEGKLVYDGEPKKAIQIYAQGLESTDLARDISKRAPTGKETVWLEHIALESVSRQENVFYPGDKVKITVEWSALQNIENFAIAVVLRKNLIAVGRACSDYTLSGEAGKAYTTAFLFDLAQLSGGYYTLDISIGKWTKSMQRILDQCDQAIGIEVQLYVDPIGGKPWQGNWGEFVLPALGADTRLVKSE